MTAAKRGLVVVAPYDHSHVIAGQGTTALELLTEAGPLDMLVVPVGGGADRGLRHRRHRAAPRYPGGRSRTGGRRRHQTFPDGRSRRHLPRRIGVVISGGNVDIQLSTGTQISPAGPRH
ncbi:hypothetical protein ACFLIM_27970 [Nonomuraea sp. M3C6]|uniref:DJ-1/PfpI family protein n=1 Tax=Nonomuraea marmarensis TaxID=3351344 RepID=A0ABW7AIA2_9ACTN